MPRVVPSDVVKAIDAMFPDMGTAPYAFPNVAASEVPSIAALVALAKAVPDQLLVLDPGQYAALLASTASLGAMGDAFQSTRAPDVLQLRVRGFRENPVALIRAAMVVCADEAPSPDTTGLAYIGDPALRDSIRLDISAAHRNLAEGEWKGATVLAGSAVEALLLWALQQQEARNPGTLATTVTALVTANGMARPRDANPETWELQHYIPVSRRLGLVGDDTATQANLARNYRNLIHPGRAARLGQKCDRATALGALAAVEAVARDSMP